MAKENRKYKDSVFCDVFYSDQSAKANLLSLYNALHGTDHTDEKMIARVRLEDVLFRDMKNDIAFLVGNQQIILGEHQSTMCENIPLRSLMYVAREYERLIPVKDRYRERRIKIPRPEFYMFFNGEAEYPTETVMKLSDAFPAAEDEPQLELTVKVININSNKKNPLLKKCRVMREYSWFVEETRKHKGDKAALEQAVRDCIKKGILADYLKRRGSEVINMLMAEYDYDMDIAVKREEAKKEGEKIGERRGEKRGEKRGILLTKEALKLHAQGKAEAEIAEILQISEKKVRMMISW